MNFLFDDDQHALRDAAKKLLLNKATLEGLHKDMDGGVPYNKELWDIMSENGYQGIGIPEEFGGAGMGYLNQVVVAEELGYSFAHTPYTSSIVGAAEAILQAGTEDQKHKYLPQLASGELIGTIAYYEQSGRYDAAGITTKESGGKLTGKKMPVIDATIAGIAVVAAQSSKGLSLYIVDMNQSSVDIAELKSMEMLRASSVVTLNGADAELLGEEGKGAELLEMLTSRMAIFIAFEQVGGATRCMEDARDYSLERYIFGKPLGTYQAIKHRISDMFMRNELARSNCYFGAWALESSEGDIAEAAALARSTAAEAFEFAAQENLQVHGGIGFTWAEDCHIFVKRMRHLDALIGGRLVWRERLFKILESKAA
ncbi:MAG: acyl-CoA/acyl-ACP dehydrogenase [Pseudomonadales bacterium]|nr:acyl-CoA/acyl-ACP dehydrogenase [Pseudomonadales bacterium]